MWASYPERCTGVGWNSRDSTPPSSTVPSPRACPEAVAFSCWGSGCPAGECGGEALRRLRGWNAVTWDFQCGSLFGVHFARVFRAARRRLCRWWAVPFAGLAGSGVLVVPCGSGRVEKENRATAAGWNSPRSADGLSVSAAAGPAAGFLAAALRRASAGRRSGGDGTQPCPRLHCVTVCRIRQRVRDWLRRASLAARGGCS